MAVRVGVGVVACVVYRGRGRDRCNCGTRWILMCVFFGWLLLWSAVVVQSWIIVFVPVVALFL